MVKTDLDLLAAELAEVELKQEKLKKVRPHDFFKPLPGGQRRFWHDLRKEKWIFGGNQSGKTTTMVNFILDLRKKIKNFRAYFGSTSFEKSKKVIQKKFYEWVNKDELMPGCWYREDEGFKNDTCMFKDGDVVFFLSYEQEPDKWSGDTLHVVAFDEEPPWHIFTEAQKRITILNGVIVGAMTALKSYTRLVNRVYLSQDPNIGLFTVPLHENHVKYGGAFTDDRIQEIINQTPLSERPSRIYGIPTYRTGLVYDEWQDKEPWVIEPVPVSNEWTRYVGIDPHGHLPQAAVLICVRPDGQMYLYDEIWEKMLVPEFARKLREKATPVDFEVALIDKHYSTVANSESGRTIQQLLMEYGDIATVGGCDDVLARIDMVKAWDKVNPATGRPMLQTFKTCTQTRWERQRYEWQAPISEKVAERKDARQKPKDKNGHLMNGLEYVAAYGGKDGLQYVSPPLSPAMLEKVRYYEKLRQERATDEYDDGYGEGQDYMQSATYMYE